MSRYVHLDSHFSDVIRSKTVKHDITHADLYVSGNCQWSSCNLYVFQNPKFLVFQCIIFAIVFYHTEFVIGCVRGIYLKSFLTIDCPLYVFRIVFLEYIISARFKRFLFFVERLFSVVKCFHFSPPTLSIDFKESRSFIVEILAGVGTTFPAIVNLSEKLFKDCIIHKRKRSSEKYFP